MKFITKNGKKIPIKNRTKSVDEMMSEPATKASIAINKKWNSTRKAFQGLPPSQRFAEEKKQDEIFAKFATKKVNELSRHDQVFLTTFKGRNKSERCTTCTGTGISNFTTCKSCNGSGGKK